MPQVRWQYLNISGTGHAVRPRCGPEPARFAAFSGIYRHHHSMPNDHAQMTSPEYAFPQH
jgi:hypothetical protein